MYTLFLLLLSLTSDEGNGLDPHGGRAGTFAGLRIDDNG